MNRINNKEELAIKLSIRDTIFVALASLLFSLPIAAQAENGLITNEKLKIKFVGVFIEAEFFKPVSDLVTKENASEVKALAEAGYRRHYLGEH